MNTAVMSRPVVLKPSALVELDLKMLNGSGAPMKLFVCVLVLVVVLCCP